MADLLTVTEYANLYGKDPGNIRRHLISGRLEGFKIGNQWVIPRDTEYPEDRRQKNGRYRNWRKLVAYHQNTLLRNTLKSLSEDLGSIYGESLREIILYGSYARGTQTEESDVDIALLLDRPPKKNVTDQMIDCVAAHELESEKVLSVIDIQTEQYNDWKKQLPFYSNIDKEGIVIWKAPDKEKNKE